MAKMGRSPNGAQTAMSDELAVDVAVRNTTVFTSEWSDEIGGGELVIPVINKLNQTVTLNVDWTPDDGLTVYQLGSFTVNANTTTVHDKFSQQYCKLKQGRVRIRYNCSLIPTTGNLTVHSQRVYTR